MRTKYILHINGTNYELRDDDLKNWEDIKCSYKRSDYGGVVRSFSSQFEFVNKAYDLLIDAYLKDRFNADASISVLTQNNQWSYDERFSCPLDFSTISWENGVLSINGVDNSLAALIKANKSTKYEFEIGSDLFADDKLAYDRIPMLESLTYQFTQGSSYNESSDLMVTFWKDELPWVGNVASEIAVNGTVAWNEDQEDNAGSYIFRVVKDVKVSLDWVVGWRSDQGNGVVNLGARIRRNGGYVDTIHDCSDGNGGFFQTVNRSIVQPQGTFSSSSELPDIDTLPENKTGIYAMVNGTVWDLDYRGYGYVWRDTGKTVEEYFTQKKSGKLTLNLKSGDHVVMLATVNGNGDIAQIRFTESQFLFQWFAIGESVTIPVFSLKNIGNSLIRKIAGDKVNTKISISDFDERVEGTYLLAAESARDLANAKFYSSFSEFCDWMSTVFGYVYYIGEKTAPEFEKLKPFGKIVGTPYTLEGTYDGVVDPKNVLYNNYRAKFFYHADSKYYEYWDGWQDYNSPDNGHPRTDTIFQELLKTPNVYWVFGTYTSGNLNPREYELNGNNVTNDCQTVHFIHRSELLGADPHIMRFGNCNNIKYSVDSSVIYSSVTIGYDKKDYESVNGRDEFNFNNTYSTGCQVNDKALSLLSKYRADSYGLEFAVQKRGEDTSDNTSDKDVFFVLCKKEADQLIPDRTIEIFNTINPNVFNGAFSPMACVKANAGFIGLQADSVTLEFASSTGNSSVVIGGVSMSDNIILDNPIATCGKLEFETDEVDMPTYVNGLIEVPDGDKIYRGYISEVDLAFARTESANYKLIVKEVVS